MFGKVCVRYKRFLCVTALGQAMLYVDGMNGVISHIGTIQWLYTLCAAKVGIIPIGYSRNIERYTRGFSTLHFSPFFSPFSLPLSSLPSSLAFPSFRLF